MYTAFLDLLGLPRPYFIDDLSYKSLGWLAINFGRLLAANFAQLQQWYRFTGFRRRKPSLNEQRLSLSDAENTGNSLSLWVFIYRTRNGREF